MARYYLLCVFTPSNPIATSSSTRYYVYSNAAQGFLFHDTEKPLQVQDILLPLHRLSELFEAASKALVLRVDAKTLVATFSLSSFPTPVRRANTQFARATNSSEWLENSGLHGWFILDVNNPNRLPVECIPDNIFSNCTELMRYTDNCPCSLQATGECASKYLYPNVPKEITAKEMQADYLIDSKALKRVRFAKLGNFQRTSGGLTTNVEFGPALRPWNDHAFELVASRSLELRVRSQTRYLRDKFRKAQCSTCCFVTAHCHNGDIEDCGMIRDCKEATDTTTAWKLLFHWYNTCGFKNMKGFTVAQRDYLIQEAGRESLVKAICDTRRTQTIWGGFVKQKKKWRYRLSAAGGDLTRYVDITTWAQLKEILTELPNKVNPVNLDSKTKLVCAILGQQYGITEPYKRYRPVYKITVHNDYVEATGASTRNETTSLALHTKGKYEDVKEVYKAVWPWQYNLAPEFARTRLDLFTV